MGNAFGGRDIFEIIFGGTAEEREARKAKQDADIAAAAAAEDRARQVGPQNNTLGKQLWSMADSPVLGSAGQADPDVLNMMGYTTAEQGATTPSAPAMPAVTGKESTLEKTPDQARATPKKSADADIVKDALDNVGKKEKGFDLDEVIRKHNGEETSGGGFITRKAISKPEKYGLVDKGYVAVKGDEGSSEQGGEAYYIYGKKEEKAKAAGAQGGASTGSKDEDFYQNAAAQVSRLHGIPDIRTFNPHTETARIVNQQKDQYFRYIFGSAVSSPDRLNPDQRKYWDAQLKELEGQVFNEVKTRYELAVNDLKGVMGRYEKSKDKFGTAREGSIIWDKNTGKIVSQMPGKDTTKRLPEGVARDVETGIASFFKPVASQGQEGMEVKTEDVFNKLDKTHKALYNEIQDDAYKILEQNPKLSGPQAVRQALQQKGWWTEADTQDKGGAMKVWRTPGGSQGNTGATPPAGYTDTGKMVNGKKAYVSPDGKRIWTP